MLKIRQAKHTIALLISVLLGSFLIAFLLRRHGGLIFAENVVEMVLPFLVAGLTGLAQTTTA